MKLALKAVFFLLGTFLHELAHYSAAAIFGKAEGFSVLPRVEGGSFIFGSVKSRVRYRVLNSLVSAAPLIWWVTLSFALRHQRIIGLEGLAPNLNLSLIWAKLRAFTLTDALYIWLFLQLAWAGRPSAQDVKNFFKGLFSPSGIAVIATLVAIFFLLKRVNPGHRFF